VAISQPSDMQSTLRPYLPDYELKLNSYSKSVSWLYRLCSFLEQEQKACKNLDELKNAITSNPELIVKFVNNEAKRRNFIEQNILSSGHVTKICKTPTGNNIQNQDLSNEISESDAIDWLFNCIEHFGQLVIASQALFAAPENVAETWTALLPATANHFQIAQLLSRTVYSEEHLAAYIYADQLDTSNTERIGFFRDVYWLHFTYAKNIEVASKRDTYEQIIKQWTKYFQPKHFEAFIYSAIRKSYGDSIYETWWALIRLNFAEILLSDYHISLNDELYDKIVDLALNEFDEYFENAGDIYWDCQPEWCNMLHTIGVLVLEKQKAVLHSERLLKYIKIKADYIP
jgi:hypothetical protein